ncbi:unnamed protein product [Linum trigynum]|uniref:Uncharacterized protein n=1 Tax=Linum trigynum TaxID=586398 RepID=A0AAV2EN24_9ROSI
MDLGLTKPGPLPSLILVPSLLLSFFRALAHKYEKIDQVIMGPSNFHFYLVLLLSFRGKQIEQENARASEFRPHPIPSRRRP